MSELEKNSGISNPLVLINTAIEKGIDPDKLGKLLDLQERWEANQAAKAHADAMLKFQSLCPRIQKGAAIPDKQGNVKYLFADYDDIMRVVQPILTLCGIVVSFDSEPVGANLKTTCFIRVGSHVEKASVTLPHPQIPNANATQMAGGALSYGQRYSLKAGLHIQIAGEDNDATELFERLKPEQIERLNELLSACREAGSPVEMPRFWGWLECADMHEMKASQFQKAEHELTRKLAQAKKVTK